MRETDTLDESVVLKCCMHKILSLTNSIENCSASKIFFKRQKKNQE